MREGAGRKNALVSIKASCCVTGIYILAIVIERGLEKRKGKLGKEERTKRVIKHRLKYLYKIHKNRGEF